MKSIAFFNNKGGVGKTSLVYHLSHMFADRGVKVLAVDLDPQANLSSMFIKEDRIETLFDRFEKNNTSTVYSAIKPLLDGEGDIRETHVEEINSNLGLVIGDLSLSRSEDDLSSQWADCLDRKPRAFRVISAFWRVIENAAKSQGAELVLIDVGPNLGAINRAALIASNAVIIPLAADLFSLIGLQNLGPVLRQWKTDWQERLKKAKQTEELKLLSMPKGEITPLGYVVLQHGIRESRPVKAYERWMNRIPSTYREFVLSETSKKIPETGNDPYCLAMLKHYRSLMSMAMETHKPIFQLKPADGAIGAHFAAVKDCYNDFHTLAKKIAGKVGLELS